MSARSGDNQGDDQLRLELHDTIFGPSEKDKPDVFKDRVNKIVREIELFAEAKQSVAHNRLGMLGLDRRTRKLK